MHAPSPSTPPAAGTAFPEGESAQTPNHGVTGGTETDFWAISAAEATAAQPEREQRRHRRATGNPPEVPGHELLRIIGTGAYGEVWLSRAATGEYRAVKVVWREDFSDSTFYEQELAGTRFYEPLSRGNYGLVPILQVGQHEREYFYCVMELADDIQWGNIIRPDEYIPCALHNVMKRFGRRPIPLDPVLAAGLHLAHGLACLHKEGLTHGDIKPSNIVYINGHPCLADAGMVSPPGQRNCSGTEGYIPPEGPGSKKADIYALAMVLYEMATGCNWRDFPTLPTGLPDGNERWLRFNRIICAAADPSPNRRRITSALQLGRRLEALRHPAVFPQSRASVILPSWTQMRRAFPQFLWMITIMGLLALMAALFLMPHGFMERLPRAWEVLMNITEPDVKAAGSESAGGNS